MSDKLVYIRMTLARREIIIQMESYGVTIKLKEGMEAEEVIKHLRETADELEKKEHTALAMTKHVIDAQVKELLDYKKKIQKDLADKASSKPFRKGAKK